MKIKFLRDYLLLNKLSLSVAVFCGYIQSCALFLLSISLGCFFSLQFHAEGNKSRILSFFKLDLSTINHFWRFLLILLIVKFLANYFEKKLTLTHIEHFTKQLREALFTAQIGQSAEEFGKKQFGKYLLRYSNDMKSVGRYLSSGIIGFWRDLLFLITGLIILSILNARLTFLSICIIISLSVIGFILAKFQKKYVINSRNSRSSLLALVTNSFSKHTKIKANNIENKLVENFSFASNKLFITNQLLNNWESILAAIFPFFHYLLIVNALFFIYENPLFAYSDALSYLFILMMLGGTFRRILKAPSAINKGKISLTKIEEILNREKELVLA